MLRNGPPANGLPSEMWRLVQVAEVIDRAGVCARDLPLPGLREQGGQSAPGPAAWLHQAVPPLTRMFCAVTQPAWSLARKATTAAISAGWPSLPKELIASRLARNCSLLPSR